MIVPAEIEQVYSNLRPLLLSVGAKAETLLRGIANNAGGRFGGVRLKPTESLYMKLERDGASLALPAITDLVAATIVIPDRSKISVVETAIFEAFDKVQVTPRKTLKPESFPYDDRHVIVRLKADYPDALPAESAVNIEVQIKTEMQAASSAITRELSYKSRALSWGKARLAGQLRALVEVADALLAAIGNNQPEPAEEDEYFASKNELLAELEQSFPEDELPSDRRRFLGVVYDMQKDCRPALATPELGDLLRHERNGSIREAQSLSIVQKIFLILLSENRLGTLENGVLKLPGKRAYVVTEFMEALCPLAKQIPADRRMQILAGFDVPA